ncbi:MAG: SIMPL domain-containing protein [Lonepinella koalarum]|nr:SIMPL domain-containing protein [Lonepinella koalarum]
MMEKIKKSSYLAIFGFILAIGLMASAFILGHQFKNLRQTGSITVKGVAEADYKSAFGTWKISVSGWGKTYAEALKDNQVQLNLAVKFLKEQGFTADEREITDIDVHEYMEEYEDNKGNMRSRQNGYASSRAIILSTKDLAKLQKGMTQIQHLRAENQYIDFSSPDYYLDDLQTIKRELISKATQDAYVRAEEFAKTSHVKVGILKSASQGAFDIKADRPSDVDSSDYGGEYDTSTIKKKVRLVVTIEYAID